MKKVIFFWKNENMREQFFFVKGISDNFWISKLLDFYSVIFYVLQRG